MRRGIIWEMDCGPFHYDELMGARQACSCGFAGQIRSDVLNKPKQHLEEKRAGFTPKAVIVGVVAATGICRLESIVCQSHPNRA